MEFWGTGSLLPLAWEPASVPGADTSVPVFADVLAATPKSQRVSQNPADGLSACASFSVELLRHPGAYRHTWLRYRTEGIFRPLSLSRALNDGPVTKGFWVPAASNETASFVHPIDAEHLHPGQNQVEVCLPGEAQGIVTISDVELVAELDHGSNAVEAISVAPFDGIPTQSALSLLQDGGNPVNIEAGQELVIAFERWISPDAVHIAANANVSWSLRCVDATAAAHELAASAVENAAGTSVYAVEGTALRRCAGLRLRPSGQVAVTRLRVFGSGSDRRIDFPRIVLASAREHFGHEAWVDGWASAPSSVGGGVRVSIDGHQTDGTTGVFASMLQRTSDPTNSWPVSITARFADGSTITRQFVLDRDAGSMPGSAGRDPTLNDGLTAEERRAKFGEVGQIAGADVTREQAARIALGTDVSLDIPARALRTNKRVSIKHLDTSQVPPLDPGLINVTAPFRHAYEFQPHGELFDDALKVTLPYQPSLVPPGYVPEDIETFYYDEGHKRWEPLTRAQVIRGRQVVESLTDHFTIMINAIVVSPEHPQAASFDANRLKGIKAATPAAGIRLIEPPEPNAHGDATLSYPLELPPGRLGVQPSFALGYSSARGNGWMGVGWDVGNSAIEAETRWGVPRYDPALETETYLMDGAQLSPIAHRDQPRARSQGTVRLAGENVKIFHPRVEGAFQRIARHGDGPRRYWWEVTDRQGKRFFYGGTPETGHDPAACLGDDAGNTFRWALREIRDTHGNRVRFDYDAVTWSAPGQVPGRELYLASAHYTLRVGETTAPYRVVFLRESACESEGQAHCRSDLIVSGRGGFKQVIGERLARIEIHYRQTLVRAWQLDYDEGPFGKSRLRRLVQFGLNNQPFPGNEHSFDYFDDVTETSNVYRGFGSTESWNAGEETPDTGFLVPDQFLGPIGAATTTAIGGSHTRSFGGHLYLGIGFGISDKWMSVGAKIGRRSDISNGRVALADVDGDGLADRIFRSSTGAIFFNRNMSGPVGPHLFASPAVPVAGLPALSRETSTMQLSVGPEAYIAPVQFHANVAFSSAEQDRYLADVNSDGLVDLVNGSKVYFNWLGSSGLPHFVPNDSSGTPVPIGQSAVDPEALPPSFEDPILEAELERKAPPVDTVRSWQAPYPGRVHISGPIQLAQVPQRRGGDGLRVSIEHQGVQLWSYTFGPSEMDPQLPELDLDVAAGERIFFRLHTLKNEWDDRVNWHPVIEYVDIPGEEDENRLPTHRFDAQADFTLAGRAGAGMQVPYTGTLQLTGKFAKLRETSDDVALTVTVDGNPVFSQVLPAASPSDVTLNENIPVQAHSFVALRIHSDSPIDATALSFETTSGSEGETRYGPWLRYVAAVDETGQAVPVLDHEGKPTFDVPLPYDMTAYSLRTPELPAQAYISSTNQTLHVTAKVDASGASRGGVVTFTAKSQGNRIGKRYLNVPAGGTREVTFDVPVTANQRVFFSFSASDPDLFASIQTEASRQVTPIRREPLPTIRYGTAKPSTLSNPYRGWAYGGYNARGERGDQPILPGDLDAPPLFDGSEIPDEQTAPEMAQKFADEGMMAFSFMPMSDNLPCHLTEEDPFQCSPAQGAHWQGPHELNYVTAVEMSATRLGGPVVRLPTRTQLAGVAAVPRISHSFNTAYGGGLGPASYSEGSGTSHSVLDFLDMNGDGYPDVVAPEHIQYTAPYGVLAERRDVPSRDLRTTGTANKTLGIGGNIAGTKSDARGQAGASAEKSAKGSAGTQQMQAVGFALNVGASKGDSSSEADLMDVNGDGLPDRVWKGDNGKLQVALNLGYRFAPSEPWGPAVIHEGSSEEVNGGASLSFNNGNYGFGGGINGSLSTSGAKAPGGASCAGSLLDINGDGLIDCAETVSDGLRVWFNLGHRMTSAPVLWRGAATSRRLNENQSISVGGGVYFTISIPLFFVSIIINPGADYSEAIQRPSLSIQDIDGDGFPDHLVSANPHQVAVARNRTGRTNLLRHVKRPLGAEMWLDYERVGNTQEMPHSRWVMNEVKVYDGLADSAELGQATDYTQQRIHYTNGRYDRYEREFYGFARVDVDNLDTRGWDGVTPASTLPVYDRQEREYFNTDYHRRGLLATSRMLDGDGSIFGRTTYAYQLRDIETGSVLTPGEAAFAPSVFPAQVEEHHYRHEGEPSAFIYTFSTQIYDNDGNVIRFYDAGGPGASDDYTAEIRYSGRFPTCRSHYIVGVADRIIVRDANGTLLRQREADVDCGSGTGNVTKIREFLNTNSVAITDLTYNSDGNLTDVTAPPNHRGQRYRLHYVHDSEVQTHVARIEDSFGYYSTAGYDFSFGVPTSEIDLNGNTVLTQYDAFGRIELVRGPYEIARGLEYAIRFTYSPDAPVPFATTAHMDAFRNVADPIETVTFLDGVGRAIQVKKDATLHRGDSLPAEDAMIVSGRIHFDPWGRIIARWHPTEEPKSASLNREFRRPIDTSAPPTRTTYDILDREREILLPNSARTQQDYALAPAYAGSGFWTLMTTIDAESNRRDTYRDARDNIRAVVEYLDGRGITTRYDYDPLKQIRRIIDAANNVTRAEYDLAGRRTDITNPDNGHTQVIYDAASNVIRRIIPNLRRVGSAIDYQYDFTHLVAIRYPQFPDNNVTYTWGTAALRGQGGNHVGRILRVDDHSGFEERRYGALGETVHERRSIDSHTMGSSANSPEIYTTQYVFDTWGRLQQMIYPDTEVLTYAYDSGGQIRAAAGVKLGTQFPYVSRLEYDRFGQRVFLQTGNGIRSHYSYDPRNRELVGLESGEFQRLAYRYDKVGNILNLTNDAQNARPNEYGGKTVQSFDYDDLYRLVGASGTWFQPPEKRNQYSYTIEYDDIHNIERKMQRHWIRNRGGGKDIVQHKTTYEWRYAYSSPKPHAATHIGDRTFFYDDNGNQTGWDNDRNGLRRTITWDEENRVRSISDNGRTTQFTYDDGGERIIKTGAQGETVYVNNKWTVRNRSVGTKHVYVGTTRVASKLSPGDAHVRPDEHDLLSVMLGNWWEHRSSNGHESGRNIEMNPHYQVPSELPDDGMPDSNFLYFFHPDHIGSTSYVTDVDGALYEHVQYFPSGETWVDQRSNTERTPHLFSGKELDQETGLYYFGARYYDPQTSLWQSADPMLDSYVAGQVNGGAFNPRNLGLFSYAYNNPLVLNDPDGRAPIDSSKWTGKEPLFKQPVASPTCSKILCNSEMYDKMDTSLAQDRVPSAIRADWFAAASLVTSADGLAAVDKWYSSTLLSGDTQAYIKDVHHALAKENYATFNALLTGKGVPGFEGLRGEKLDRALVDKEQALVTDLTAKHFGSDVAKMKKSINEINELFDPSNLRFKGNNEPTQQVIKERFQAKGKKFDFGNESDRRELGYGLVEYVRKARSRHE